MGDNRLEPLVLSGDERRTLENWVKRRSTAQGLALRARIVLACAQGGSNIAVAARLGVNRKTVNKWRGGLRGGRVGGVTPAAPPGGARPRRAVPAGRRGAGAAGSVAPRRAPRSRAGPCDTEGGSRP